MCVVCFVCVCVCVCAELRTTCKTFQAVTAVMLKIKVLGKVIVFHWASSSQLVGGSWCVCLRGSISLRSLDL